MHVVLISNCEKAALARTRTLLDRYATRIGDRAWATRITQAALDELWSALKRQASRHTSVACYRSDTTTGLRLAWVVGNRQSYDANERFAIATAQKKKVFPMPYRHAALVAQFAGYTHDFGKASQRFQGKLVDGLTPAKKNATAEKGQADPIRHEWLSTKILQDIGAAQLSKLSAKVLEDAWAHMPGQLTSIANLPLSTPITHALEAAGWAVCTHHGAMGGGLNQKINSSRHVRPRGGPPLENLTLAFTGAFSPSDTDDAARWAALFSDINKTADRIKGIDRPSAYWEGVMLMARAALILADHRVSSQTLNEPPPVNKAAIKKPSILYANTKPMPDRTQGKKGEKSRAAGPTRYLDQPLSWHLQQVGDAAGRNMRMLSGDGLPAVDPGLVRAILDQRADEDSRYVWQDKAADHVRDAGGSHLVFNVASTGSGKTLGNLKVAFALRPDAVRLAVAFNLRSLTAQTFAAFGKHLSAIDKSGFDRDFACLMGERVGKTVDFSKEDEDDIDIEDVIDLEGAKNLQIPAWMADFAQDRRGSTDSDRLAKLIVSPALVSTMDWIVAAGEPGEQARHAKALIRVANSDLILDEVDSFDVKASVAVMRVVQIAAMFGRNVIVSSATLNPALAEGLCLAYAKGREVHDAMFGLVPWHLTMVSDQFAPSSLQNPTQGEAMAHYRQILCQASKALANSAVTKRYRLASVTSQDDFTAMVIDQAAILHDSQAITPPGLQCRLSIGLVRVANIKPCMDIAESLREDGRFFVTAYHAQDVQQRRAKREVLLDKILDRNSDAWVQALCAELPWLKGHRGDVRLIVVATPVEEVGRDHDFDWAIIEPSSMHSIIQTAGRVNRHRRRELRNNEINVCLLSRNLRALGGEKTAFIMPGLETEIRGHSSHSSHDLNDLLRTHSGYLDTRIDAGMVFDETGRQTMFARDDEAAVRHHIGLAIPIIARSKSHETHFMTHEFSKAFPLRGEDMPIEYTLLCTGKFAESGRMEVPIGSWRTQKIPDRTWLTWSAEQLDSQDKLPVSVSIRYRGKTDEIEVTWNGVNTCHTSASASGVLS